MAGIEGPVAPTAAPVAGRPARPKRADAQRNEQTLLVAAAAVFVTSGVNAPVRDIAAKAGVGMGTIYRHFPTRADLVVAVYRHQVEACAQAGPELLATCDSPHAALARWAGLFVDFVATKHGLAAALRSDSAGFEALHDYFLDRLVPVCAQLLDAAIEAGEITSGIGAFELMWAIGNLCVGDQDPRYNARRLVGVLIAGLGRTPQPECSSSRASIGASNWFTSWTSTVPVRSTREPDGYMHPVHPATGMHLPDRRERAT